MLNEDPKLPKGRLTRVRQRQEFSRKSIDDEPTKTDGAKQLHCSLSMPLFIVFNSISLLVILKGSGVVGRTTEDLNP